ncbi:MAG: hypothetical protein F4X11_12410 [Acidobacteria bacterium]|nr:hypothetical protein [Acidobacteriota bacterium]MYH29263.1 hypothetical protein [Acidobacteriota bacterium]MYN65812.1 hypothetical protein [Acidobacteriota bacterium]
MPSTQLTLRNVDPELSRRLRAISEERGDSVNSTVLRLLRDAVGLNARRERLRRYAGWTADDLEEFDAALRTQRVIDARSWE